MRPPTKGSAGRERARALRAFGLVPGGLSGAAEAHERAAASMPSPAPEAAEQMRHLLSIVLYACPVLRLDLPGPPRPKGRPRTYVGADGKPHTKTPPETEAYERHARAVARLVAMANGWPLGGRPFHRYAVDVDLVLAEDAGDVDNVIKSLFDALNGVVWRDDKEVCLSTSTRKLAAPGERPGARVTVWALAIPTRAAK
jgi:Holliday junction resolvase RusA-like endonuclease